MSTNTHNEHAGLRRDQAVAKRIFDILFAVCALAVVGWVIAIAYVIARLDTRASGFFVQQRIGRNGRPFGMLKIRTMRGGEALEDHVTMRGDPRITSVGRWFRRTKIDELPQLINVLLGDMSIVGPRPDIAGFADVLKGEDRAVLSVRPGLTSAATLKYQDEEILLAQSADPVAYNREVIFPDKVRMNRSYVENYSFATDLRLVAITAEAVVRRTLSMIGVRLGGGAAQREGLGG